MANFAVKDVMDLELTPLGGGEKITINYLNSCTLTWDEEVMEAMEKGSPSVIFKKPKTGEFKISAQVVNEDYLALAMGGVKTGDKISVSAISPNTAYSCVGKFRVTEKGGVDKMKKITLASITPVASGELSLAGDDIATFDITFKIVSNNGKFIDWDNDLSVLSVEK